MAIGNAIRGAGAAGRMVAAGALLALAAACASPPEPFPELPRLGVATQFTSRHVCGLGVSPPIAIASAPPATAQYRVRLTNTDVLLPNAWQTTADAAPGGLAEGALADYQAPCIGDLQINSFYPYYMYRLEVLALDSQSRPLAYGYTTVQVQSVTTLVDRERSVAGRSAPPAQPIRAAPTLDPRAADTIGNFVSPALVPQMGPPVYQR